ncbi:hypothetical protein ABIC89_000253 [Variovorax boronicumulans]|uniref:hypothetical protein n=1 Tax=Variovorax boronicumulans TaxID=436515 RepID=UPI003397BBF4
MTTIATDDGIELLDASAERTATAAYQAYSANITILLAKLDERQRDHAQRASKEPDNWGFAGDLGGLQQVLLDAVERINLHWRGT